MVESKVMNTVLIGSWEYIKRQEEYKLYHCEHCLATVVFSKLWKPN